MPQLEVLGASLALQAIDAIATLFAQAYLLARQRLTIHASPVVRLMAQRSHLRCQLALRDRELAVLRSRVEGMEPHRRPHYSGPMRQEILLLTRLNDWTVEVAAQHFVVHGNTIRLWLRAVRDGRAESLLGKPAWNRFDDGVRWLVHQIRELCPEAELGIRGIAAAIVRHGIAISKSTVQRVLKEQRTDKPTRTTPGDDADESEVVRIPDNLLTPGRINRVWHIDLSTIKLVWKHFYVAAVVDGYSRRLLALKFYASTPTTQDALRLIRSCIRKHGRPRFVVSDWGCQFRDTFHGKLKEIGVTHVRGRVKSCQFNGKVERLFRTFKMWARVVLLGLNPRSIQRRLDCYREWYNVARPHASIGARTPDEAWNGVELPEPIAIYARDPIEPIIEVERQDYRGDPHLPVLEIDARLRLHRAA
ncbi:MAG: DDE-type integrase/transposase/recombinase [Phycisphaera sp.]|nr:DDE-type integrase/transposase/recombinase [Phycisphaera sp.]